ncbi:MAG: EI24 domain-containing protein [Burkholderiaceae bacterium]|nr:EI24 domain-containing protein [Burkholderiaceae bacterium]MDO9088762.1 EI24 domain-containing protein [Burkholderiaceae bacterium]
MGLLLDSFWRAAAYCLHPRVIALSILPLLLMVVLALGLGYFLWTPALDWVASMLEASTLLNRLWDWLQSTGMGRLKTVVAPLVLVFAITPLIVILSLLAVALLMTPALVSLVAERRFPQLQRKKGGSLLVSLFWSLGSTLMALAALIVTVPLWLVPPLILVLPPLIWGWLTYRVICFDALADHASKEERREVLRRHRGWLLGMGLLCGYLGAAPSLLWASSALFAVAFVILAPLAIWIYTLVFAFSSLWFTHYCLYALEQLRRETGGEIVDIQANNPDSPAARSPAAGLPLTPPGLPDESKALGLPPA